MVRPDAPRFWTPLMAHFGLSPRQARRLWAALRSSTGPAVTAIRYTLHRADERLGDATDTDFERFIATPWTPHKLIEGLERLITEGLLTRSTANELEERIRRATARQGAWK